MCVTMMFFPCLGIQDNKHQNKTESLLIIPINTYFLYLLVILSSFGGILMPYGKSKHVSIG